MSKPNQLRVGVIMTYINLALGSLIPMFYTPVILRLLGQSNTAFWDWLNPSQDIYPC